ncbi:hypothetical protein IQ264_17355 [Phormidium sp. LEGE 05292]|uniref:hypothetical protein n=1 Tax=[Phormidium] sp. LEGE 05292 TaxID=767427 RepID=UPI001880BFB2|nr:hypothetical protein [Phormidium sp. LEGE 05292]MBE9227197.1 hypothetical protein [Phormidium sp. LEGE 05292]
MIAIVVTINILIALFNFYLAWRIWQIRRSIAGATRAILAADRNTYNVLHNAPKTIIIGQKGTKSLREQYQKLEIQLEKLGQVLGILNFTQQFWQKRARQNRQLKKLKKSLSKY